MLGYMFFGIAMYARLSFSLAAGRDKTLVHRAERATALLTSCHIPNPKCTVKYEDFAAGTPEGNLISIFDMNGNRVFPVKKDPSDTFPLPPTAPLEEREFSKVQYNGTTYRMLSESVTVDSVKYRIVIGGQLKDNRYLVSQFKIGLFWATPVLLAFSATFGYFLSTRALNPVGQLIASVRSITIGNLAKRLPTIHSGDELEALTETCNEMLARLDTAVNQITRFTADASHELRHPISYIYTLSESALRNSSLDEESTESFEEIVRECKEATSLLDDMLTLARCDAGHTEIVFARTDLTAVLKDVYVKAAPYAARKQLRLLIDLERTEPTWIMGDASSLKRLFWIIIDNAVKYTPLGGEINLELQIRGGEARVSIRDSGVGIPQGALSEIFGRFYRLEKTRNESEGSGLGLSIAKWISEIHRGKLSVQSVENQGSTFQVAFGTIKT